VSVSDVFPESESRWTRASWHTDSLVFSDIEGKLDMLVDNPISSVSGGIE
jgi:hypothetical protein